MTRNQELSLLEFCQRQKAAFAESAWYEMTSVSAKELSTVALYLAGTDWFGNRELLQRVAEKLHSGSMHHFTELMQETGFEPSRFRGLLKARLSYATLP